MGVTWSFVNFTGHWTHVCTSRHSAATGWSRAVLWTLQGHTSARLGTHERTMGSSDMTRYFVAPCPQTQAWCVTRMTYAVLAGGRWWFETLCHGELAAACVIRVIRRLGLNLSPSKSKAIWFYDYRCRGTPPFDLCLDISGEEVECRTSDEILGPHYRQSMDVRAALQAPGSQSDDDNQRSMWAAAEYRWGRSRSAPTV